MGDQVDGTGDFTGGCQCGAIRYRVTSRPEGTHYCHCRMCQRAVGNLFAALTMVPAEDLIWEQGRPATFDSSNVAERGFCRDCGTPLFFHYKASDEYALTIGSLDHPERVAAEKHYGIESQVPWHVIGDALPREPTDPTEPALTGLASRQDPADG